MTSPQVFNASYFKQPQPLLMKGLAVLALLSVLLLGVLNPVPATDFSKPIHHAITH